MYASARAQGVNEPDLLRALGDTRVACGRDVEALEAYEAALAQQPGDPDVRVSLALALHRLGHPERAMEHYRALRSANAVRAEQLFKLLRAGSL